MAASRKRSAFAEISDDESEFNPEISELAEKMKEFSKKQQEMSNRMDAKFEELSKKIDPDQGKSLLELSPVEKRKFKLSHTFKRVSEGTRYVSVRQNFFGIDWIIRLQRKRHELFLEVAFFKKANPRILSIGAEVDFTAICRSSPNGTWGQALVMCDSDFQDTPDLPVRQTECVLAASDSMEFCQLHADAKKNEIEVTAEVTIKKMTGLSMTSESFGESEKKYSDVALIVGGRKFYVNKKYLASRSSVFDRMFFSSFEESRKKEIEINEIDEEDFEAFLKVLHGQDAIADQDVESLLHLVQFFDAPHALQVIEKFLMTATHLRFQKLWFLSRTYKMPRLGKHCISRMDIDQVDKASKEDDLFMPLPVQLAKRAVELYRELVETMEY